MITKVSSECFLRMVQPKYRIERGVGNVAHVTSIADKSMDGVVDVFDIIVPTAALIRVSGIGKGTILRLRSDELIDQRLEPASSQRAVSETATQPHSFPDDVCGGTHAFPFASSLLLEFSG